MGWVRRALENADMLASLVDGINFQALPPQEMLKYFGRH